MVYRQRYRYTDSYFTRVIPGWEQDDAGDVVASPLVKELLMLKLNGRVYTPTLILQIIIFINQHKKITKDTNFIWFVFTWCCENGEWWWNMNLMSSAYLVITDSPPPPPPDSIMVGLTDDLPILLEIGLDCPSLSLLSCLGRDLESPTETQDHDRCEETTKPAASICKKENLRGTENQQNLKQIGI